MVQQIVYKKVGNKYDGAYLVDGQFMNGLFGEDEIKNTINKLAAQPLHPVGGSIIVETANDQKK